MRFFPSPKNCIMRGPGVLSKKKASTKVATIWLPLWQALGSLTNHNSRWQGGRAVSISDPCLKGWWFEPHHQQQFCIGSKNRLGEKYKQTILVWRIFWVDLGQALRVQNLFKKLQVNLGWDGHLHYCTLGIQYIPSIKHVSQGLFTIRLFMFPENFPFLSL